MENIGVRDPHALIPLLQHPDLHRKRGFTAPPKVSMFDSPQRRVSIQSRNSNPEIGVGQSKSLETCSESDSVAGGCVSSPSHRTHVKKQIQSFWQNSPCDSWFTNEARGTPAFYRSLDEHRYKVHPGLCLRRVLRKREVCVCSKSVADVAARPSASPAPELVTPQLT